MVIASWEQWPSCKNTAFDVAGKSFCAFSYVSYCQQCLVVLPRLNG